MTLRYVGMLMVSAVAGVLSGAIWVVPNGLMGGVLGMSLTGGAIWLGSRQRKQGGELTRGQILGAGLASGLLGGGLMAAVSQACAHVKRGEFGPPVLPFWAPLALGLAYGVVIHWGYATRRSSSHPFWKALLCTCLGCFLLKTFAVTFYLCAFEHGNRLSGILFGSAMMSLVGAVPFALLWVMVMVWTDPAWRTRPQGPESLPTVPAAAQDPPLA